MIGGLERVDTLKLHQIIWDIFIYGHYYRREEDRFDIEEIPKLLGLTQIPDYTFCISIDDYSHMSVQEQQQIKDLIRYTISKVMDNKEYFLVFAHQNCFYLNGHMLDLKSYGESPKSCLQELARKIKSVLNGFGISITIGIDFCKYQHSSVEIWRGLAQHAIVAQRRKFFEGKDQIYFYEPFLQSNTSSYSTLLRRFYSEIRYKLLNAIITGDMGKVRKVSSLLITDIFRNNLDRLFYLRIKIIETGILLICDMIELGFPESKLSQMLTEFIERINSLYDVVDLAETFYLLIDYLVNLAIQLECKPNSIVLKVKSIIDSSEDLSEITLSKAAKISNVSYAYLSRLFKKELGITFTEYINRERIKRAFPLLSDKQTSLKDIAFCSGFRDLQQFERVFKRFFNMTPSQYRKFNTPKRT